MLPALDPATPIYASGFVLQLIRRRMLEYNLWDENRFRVFKMSEPFRAGPFEVEPMRVTHSIPDCCGIVLRSEFGSIVHTGGLMPLSSSWRGLPSVRFATAGLLLLFVIPASHRQLLVPEGRPPPLLLHPVNRPLAPQVTGRSTRIPWTASCSIGPALKRSGSRDAPSSCRTAPTSLHRAGPCE